MLVLVVFLENILLVTPIFPGDDAAFLAITRELQADSSIVFYAPLPLAVFTVILDLPDHSVLFVVGQVPPLLDNRHRLNRIVHEQVFKLLGTQSVPWQHNCGFNRNCRDQTEKNEQKEIRQTDFSFHKYLLNRKQEIPLLFANIVFHFQFHIIDVHPDNVCTLTFTTHQPLFDPLQNLLYRDTKFFPEQTVKSACIDEYMKFYFTKPLIAPSLLIFALNSVDSSGAWETQY